MIHGEYGADYQLENNFVWADYAARDSYDDIVFFLGEQQRKLDGVSFLLKAADLLQTVNKKGEVKIFESQFVEWMKALSVEFKQNFVEESCVITLHKLLDIRMGIFREKERTGDFDSMQNELTEIVKIVDLGCESEILTSNIVEISSGKNILNRRHGIWCLSGMKNPKTSIYLLGRIFEEMNSDESIDIVDSLGFSYIGRRSEFSIIDKLKNVDDDTASFFWQSVLRYSNRILDDGYEPTVIEWLDEVFESEDSFKVDERIPERLKKLTEMYAHEEKTVFIENELWGVVLENTSIGILFENLRMMDYDERYRFLKDNIANEEPIAIQFLAKLFNKGMPYGEGMGMDTGDLSVLVDQLSSSKKILEIWKLIASDPKKFVYQIGLMLAHIPINSFEQLSCNKIDVVEGVRLVGSDSSLCGYADIYMAEAINVGRVKLLEKGRLLYKDLRAPAALCLEDFVVDSGDGVNRVVFKRGCYYSPRGGDLKESEWRYVRPVGGDEIPRASENLIRLADKCAEKLRSVSGV